MSYLKVGKEHAADINTLLQRLGQRTSRGFQSWLATECRCF